jgi:glycerol uptake facilitator protein
LTGETNFVNIPLSRGIFMSSYAVFWGELIGTLLLILLGNGAVANVLLGRSKGHGGGWIVIAAGWGFAVAIALYVSGWASGGHFNPAVTLAFCIAKKTAWGVMPVYLAGQFIGAFLGAIFVFLAYMPHWQKTHEPNLKLLCFATQPAIRSYLWNFVVEAMATAVLIIGILGILHAKNAVSPEFAPYAIGILIFSIGLSLGGPTGYAINPARDFSPRLVYTLFPIRGKGGADWRYAWVPVLGPLFGGALGSAVYLLFVEPLASFL